MAPFGAMRLFDRNGLKAEIIAVRASEMTEYQVRAAGANECRTAWMHHLMRISGCLF